MYDGEIWMCVWCPWKIESTVRICGAFWVFNVWQIWWGIANWDGLDVSWAYTHRTTRTIKNRYRFLEVTLRQNRYAFFKESIAGRFFRRTDLSSVFQRNLSILRKNRPRISFSKYRTILDKNRLWIRSSNYQLGCSIYDDRFFQIWNKVVRSIVFGYSNIRNRFSELYCLIIKTIGNRFFANNRTWFYE